MRHNFGSDIFFSVGWNSALTACLAVLCINKQVDTGLLVCRKNGAAA